MTAIVVVPVGWSVLWAVGSIAVILAAWVLLSYWGQPKAKRIAAATVLAGVLAVGTVHGSEDAEFVMSDPCKKYTSSDAMWWIAGCFLP